MENTTNKVTALRLFLGFSSIKNFADFLDIGYTTVHNWEKRGNLPDAVNIAKISSKVPSLNPLYFTGSNQPMFLSKDVDKSQPESLPVRPVTVYGKVTAGETIGLWNYNSEPLREMAISHERINGIKDKLYGFTVYGDSMRERYHDGDEVAAIPLDFEYKKPRDGDIVVVFLQSDMEIIEPHVKLFQWVDKARGDFLLKSINPYFKDMLKNKKEVTKIFRVIFNISFVDYRENRK